MKVLLILPNLCVSVASNAFSIEGSVAPQGDNCSGHFGDFKINKVIVIPNLYKMFACPSGISFIGAVCVLAREIVDECCSTASLSGYSCVNLVLC